MNQSNYEKRSITYKYLRPIVLSLLLLLSLAIQILYLLVSHFGNVYDVFIFTAPFYIILCIFSFFPSAKLSWKPISLFLFSIYCLFNTYFNSSIYPFHTAFIILLGISVLLDFAYFIIDTYDNFVTFDSVKKVLLIVIHSIITVSGAFLLYGIFGGEWVFTPFSNLLNRVYIPFSIIIITMCFLYYTFLISKPTNFTSKERIGVITGVIFGLTFIFTLIIMITPMWTV